jgi:hypothetical protein
MESVLSIVGAFTALVSAIIALTAFTAEARLHRRISKLQSVASLMAQAPSPVIHRALRFALAELQSREALREQQRYVRSLSFVFPPLKILFAALFATFLLAYVFPTPVAADFSAALAMGLLWLPTSIVTTGFLAHSYLLEFKRRDFRNAFFLGETPDEEAITLSPLYKISEEDVRRSIAAGLFVAVACDFAGIALSFLVLAMTTAAYSAFYFAAAGLFSAIAAGLYVHGHAPRVRAKDSSVWPWPKPSDFHARS